MPTLDNDTIVKIAAGFAIVVAALVTVMLGLYAQLKIRRFELQMQARKDRAAQRLTYYLPLLKFCYEFDGRIDRILAKLETDWLKSDYLVSIRAGEGFAKDPLKTGYFILSSTYVFACFFGWTEAIKKGVDPTKSFSEKTIVRRWLSRKIRRGFRSLFHPSTGNIFFFDPDINVVRRLFQFQELFADYVTSRKLSKPRDAFKLHRHLQHSIGEMMLVRDGDSLRCKTFREFSEEYRASEAFRYWFVPLEDLFADLSGFEANKDIETQAEMKNDIRPLRLLAIRYWCRILMKNLSHDIGIETPEPDEILSGVSPSLRLAITSVSIETLESHLGGIPHKKPQ